MKSAPEPLRTDPTDDALGEFTRESITQVRDFSTRKTLEQAHAFARGLAEIFLQGLDDAPAADLAVQLASVGISLADAEQIAGEGSALVQLMAERDRKAEIFHAAVMAASDSERALYERLASFASLLRAKLGAGSAVLEQLGVPPQSADTMRSIGRGPRPLRAPHSPSPPSK